MQAGRASRSIRTGTTRRGARSRDHAGKADLDDRDPAACEAPVDREALASETALHYVDTEGAAQVSLFPKRR